MKEYLTGRKREDYRDKEKCPRCGGRLPLGRMGAISKYDDKTELCAECGLAEALERHAKAMGSDHESKLGYRRLSKERK